MGIDYGITDFIGELEQGEEMPRADEEYILPSPLNADTVDNYDTSTTAVESRIPVMGASGYMPDATVDTTALKTAAGEVSTSSNSNLVMPGGAYGFYPQTKSSNGSATAGRITIAGLSIAGNGLIPSSYGTYIAMNVNANTLYANQRYVTASGQDHWLFLLIAKVTKDIVSAYSAPDHPAYGNGGDFNKMPHPFGSYDETKHEIVLVDNDTIAELKTQVTREKSLLTLVNELYKPNMDKEEIYKPLHSGRFIDKKPELVQSIPDYIKVRKLIKLNNIELQEKETNRQLAMQKVEQDKIEKQLKMNALKYKLDLTDEEMELLTNA